MGKRSRQRMTGLSKAQRIKRSEAQAEFVKEAKRRLTVEKVREFAQLLDVMRKARKARRDALLSSMQNRQNDKG